jgi:YbgC/YbaW family acyl-CoA thioester hydrolase
MARIKINLPESFFFTATIPIRITDLNYGGHVGNDTVLSLLHEARVQFLNHFNYTELKFEGVALIMSDVAIEFKMELFYGDVIKAYITTGDFGRVGFDIFYKLVNEKDERIVATAKTGMVCYDYEKKKVVAMPEESVRKLKNY